MIRSGLNPDQLVTSLQAQLTVLEEDAKLKRQEYNGEVLAHKDAAQQLQKAREHFRIASEKEKEVQDQLFEAEHEDQASVGREDDLKLLFSAAQKHTQQAQEQAKASKATFDRRRDDLVQHLDVVNEQWAALMAAHEAVVLASSIDAAQQRLRAVQQRAASAGIDITNLAASPSGPRRHADDKAAQLRSEANSLPAEVALLRAEKDRLLASVRSSESVSQSASAARTASRAEQDAARDDRMASLRDAVAVTRDEIAELNDFVSPTTTVCTACHATNILC